MKRIAVFAPIFLALAFCHGAQGEAAWSGENYCPPGSKFCPAPGASVASADTDFGFGVGGGQTTAFRTPTPEEIANSRLKAGESLLLVSPNTAPAPRNAAPTAVAFETSPKLPKQPASKPESPAPKSEKKTIGKKIASTLRPQSLNVFRNPEPHSEVANETSRKTRKQIIANDEKIPWWKGGAWRNKKDRDSDASDGGVKSKSKSKAKSDDKPKQADKGKPPPKGASRDAPPPRTASGRAMDDGGLWDDDYDGYNPDGTFGRPAGNARRNAAATDDPYDNPYTAPFGGPAYAGGGNAPQAPYGDPYPAPQDSQGTAAFLGEPYTDPAYGSPYAGSGYGSPYGTAGGADSMSGYAFPDNPSGGYGSPYGAATSWGGESPQAIQSPYQAAPSVDAQGSPQFENAVRMVKEQRFSEAKNILSSETSRNPSNAAAWRWLADCHYNLLELDDANSCYQRSLERDPNDYYALRGQGFAYLHRGHEYWRRMQEEVAKGAKEQAAATFAQAHENYKKSLEMLGLCLRRAPNDGEAVYGEAMAAEGASRKLYSNAISYLKLGPEHRERAELFAENCLTVINKGIERSKERARENPGDAGPRALLGGLYLRKAILYHQLGKNDLALIELRNSRDVQQSILDEIDKNNEAAKKNLREVETYWEDWGGNRQ